ncbi:hypothetical protein pipiens_012252 [Culex pipiens pipiens]|uniref:PDZ domain-containing protein n=1 Tax=Culex pipiens pipiens TaxID=38569 RepID=A0ABD1D354_CULPP
MFLHLSSIRVEFGCDCLSAWVLNLQYLMLRACDVIKGMLLHLNVVCTVLRQVQLGLMATVDDAILMTLCLSLLRLALLIVFRCPVTDESNILFCTLNSHKVDMSNLLGGQIGLNDFIFAHKKGRPKEVEIVKSEDALGLTITDNGAGYAFIKRIKSGSVIDRIPHIQVGDHIEKLDGVNVVGKRHYEVARMLKDIPTGSTFTIRLVEPMKSGFQGIAPRNKGGAKQTKQGYGSGKETLRFKSNGNAAIEDEHDDATQCGIDAINSLLDSFMGINDTELATQIWDLGSNKTNSMDFAEAIDASDLEAFGFTDDFIIELWGAVTDARQGRHKR